MTALLKRLFRPRIIEMPELCKRRLGVSELQSALRGQHEEPRVQAIVQLLAMKRLDCLEVAKTEAWKGQDTKFQLGGANALEELLLEVESLLEGRAPGEDVKRFFAEAEKR